MKIQVLIVIPNDNLGGAEQYLKMVGDYFSTTKNATVSVVFFKKRVSGAWDNSGHDLYYGKTNKERYGVFHVIKQLYKLKAKKFDYTFTSHIHTNGLVGCMIKLSILKTKYFIGRESTSTFSRFDGLKLTIFKMQYVAGYSAMDLLICQSEFMKKQLINGLPWINETTKIRVIVNPINLQASTLKSDQKLETDLFSFQYIISAGRFIEEKGFDILIDSFYSLSLNFPDLKLIILGEGNLREKLDEKITSLKLEDKVLLPGFVDNVYPYFKKARLCVVSSRIEGFPNVLLQMMSQNNNVVSTLCAGGIESITGLYTADPNDAEGLKNQILKCLQNDNTQNREFFDNELESRSLESFVSKINFYLNEA